MYVSMGKVKRARWGKERLKPTGLPSLRETERSRNEDYGSSEVTLPVLEKLSSEQVAEREWACRSVAYLLYETESQQLLINHQGLPRSIVSLLLDSEWSVREAAAGALRNLSSVGGDDICECLVRNDVMTTLSTALKQCVAEIRSYSSGRGSLTTPHLPSLTASSATAGEGEVGAGKSPKRRDPVDVHHILATAEQGLHLLLNISEGCTAVLDAANREELVLVLLFFLQPSLFFPDILTTAAMCLYTLTEDNPPSRHLLTSSPSHLSQLESLLNPVSGPQLQPHSLIVASAAAGVFQHILPSLSVPPSPQLVSSVFSGLASVLDADITPLLTTLTSTPPHTPPQSDEVDSVWTAQLLALETIANFCCTESEEGEWEDVEEEEVMIGGNADDIAMEMEPEQQVPDWLAGVLVEMGMLQRLWKKCCLSPSSYTASLPPQLSTRWHEVQVRAMAALQNMLTALPHRVTSCNTPRALAMWRGVVEMVATGDVAVCEEAMGLLAVLAGLLSDEERQCVSVNQLEVLAKICQERLSTSQDNLLTNIIHIMATVSRQSLHLPLPLKSPLMEVVGRALCECVSCGESELVVARALDTLYDVFGADECPVRLLVDLQIIPTLKRVAAQFSDRVSVHKQEVVCARDNLQPFINYVNTRTCSK